MRGFGKRTAEVERGPKCRPHLAVTRSPPVRRRNVRRDREQVYEPSLTDTGRGPLPDRGAGCTSFDPHSRSLPSRGSPADGAPDRVGEVASALVGVVRLPGDARRGLGAGAAPVTANRGVRSGARGRPRCIRPAMHPVPGCVGSAALLLAARDAPPFTPCRAGAGALQPAGGLVGLGVRRRKAPLLGQPIRQVVRAVPRRQTPGPAIVVHGSACGQPILQESAPFLPRRLLVRSEAGAIFAAGLRAAGVLAFAAGQ